MVHETHHSYMLWLCCSSEQIERQRLYLQRIWRNDHKGFITNYGRPPNYVPQYLVSLGGTRQVKTAVEDFIL